MDAGFWIVGLLAVGALAATVWWMRQRQGAVPAPIASTDQFTVTPVMSAAEMELLNYLAQAFHGRPVLFRVALSHMVSARKTQDRRSTQQRLGTHVVDYAVCNRKGVPVYAFELDTLHDDTDDAERDAKEKHQILKSANIPLIRLKRSTRELPSPAEFRRLLRGSEPVHSSDSETDPPPSGFHSAANGLPSSFGHTRPPSMTDLMGLPEPASPKKAPRTAAEDEAWAVTQQV